MGTKFDELKVALVIDDLLYRDAAIGMFEELIGLFPNSTVYTFSHQQGGILGPVEQRKIISTYLTNKVQQFKDWKKYQFLISNAKEQLVIPCSFDLCIKFSRGLGHLVPVCSGVPVLTYFFDDSRFGLKKDLFRQKIFSAMISNLVQSGLKASQNVYFSTSSLKEKYLPHSDAGVIKPGVNRKEFKPFPKALIDSMGGRTITLIDTTDLDEYDRLRTLVNKLKSEDVDYHLVGQEINRAELIKAGFDEKRIMGAKCAGELTPLFQRAKVVITAVQHSFPEIALQARSSATPVVQLTNQSCFEELLKESGVIKTDLENVFINQVFSSEVIADEMINYESWKKEMFIAINKVLVATKKEQTSSTSL